MKYLQSPISEQQVRKIQSVVDALQAKAPKDLIVFRGQQKLTKEVRAEVLRERPLKESVREYKKAAKAEADDAAKFIARVSESRYPGAFDRGFAAHLKTLSGAEMLAIKSQQQFASRYLVSTTRDLAIAFGDFYKAPQVRYIYIMQVPKQHTINVHGLVAEKTKSMNLPKQNNQREKELAIPLQATEYVRAVYDIKADKLIAIKAAGDGP